MSDRMWEEEMGVGEKTDMGMEQNGHRMMTALGRTVGMHEPRKKGLAFRVRCNECRMWAGFLRVLMMPES